MANQISVNSSTGNIQITTSRSVIGTVANVATANFANFAGNVTASNQPNITNVGTLGNLSVSGTVTSGNVSTPIVYSQGMVTQGYDFVQMQYSNGVALPVNAYDIGTGSWFYLDAGGATFQSNTTGTFKQVILGNDGTINASGNITAPYFIGNGSQLTGIVANSVANANFANFAGTAFNVNASNITGTVANANYSAYAGQANTANLATYATTANSVAGSNVSGEVANANYASYSNLANTANSVAVGNVSGIGNIAVINLDGNVSNLLTGNGTFVAIPTVIGANYANFAGDVVNSTQSNITSVGNLINLRVENANVHLGTNAGLGNIGTDIIAIGNNSAGSNIVVSTNFVSWDGGTAILEVTDTTGIARGYTVSGTGFTLGQTVYSVMDSGNLEMYEYADGTPSGVMTFSSMQGNGSVAIGNNAGYTTQNAGSVAIGNNAGYTGQFSQAVAIGDRAGNTNQGAASLALGAQAGSNTQGSTAVAVGYFAGSNTQGGNAVAIGSSAGSNTQGVNAVAVGRFAGFTSQGGSAVAVGNGAGSTGQGICSVAIGNRAGRLSQGGDSIAIGGLAGFASQANNSIILNATGSTLNQTTANTFTVKPVRQANTSNVMYYNSSTGEISYDVISISNVANANYANFAGTAYSVDGANVSGEVANANYASYSDIANYANFAGDVVNSAQPNITSVANSFTSGQLTLNTTGAGTPILQLNGVVGSSNGSVQINQGFLQINNEDLGGGQSPFQFNIFGNSGYQEPMNYFRARGTQASPLDCSPGDVMLDQRWQVRANGSTQGAFLAAATYLGYTSGLGAYSRYTFTSIGDVANTEIIFNSGIIKFQGNVTLGTSTGNTVVANNSLFALSVYTAAALTAITGTIGQMACVSDSAGGGNPNGMIAFWDTTNSRWSYVHDNSAV